MARKFVKRSDIGAVVLPKIGKITSNMILEGDHFAVYHPSLLREIVDMPLMAPKALDVAPTFKKTEIQEKLEELKAEVTIGLVDIAPEVIPIITNNIESKEQNEEIVITATTQDSVSIVSEEVFAEPTPEPTSKKKSGRKPKPQ